MGTTRLYRRLGHRIWGGVADFLVILLLVPVTRPWAPAPPLGGIPGQRSAPVLQVVVDRGRLSVNL